MYPTRRRRWRWRLIPSKKIEFKVTDAGGREVVQAGLPYDGETAAPGTLRVAVR